MNEIRICFENMAIALKIGLEYKTLALAIRTADRMNNSVAIRTADCAAITRWRLFSRFCHTRINVCSN